MQFVEGVQSSNLRHMHQKSLDGRARPCSPGSALNDEGADDDKLDVDGSGTDAAGGEDVNG
jgi:hypothetical protein